jgi:predicted 3-demethylubiquinone-9 3-methyltransferase (glyoxalase superfamily)
VQCGWLKDKYGLSWQIVPAAFIAMMKDEKPENAVRKQRAVEAMMQMKKLDVMRLQAAWNG